MTIAERVSQPTSAGRIVIRCLGRLRLEAGSGDQLQIRTRKSRAMLALLALPGRPMSREAVADLLWSDRADEQARSSLRQTIFELQHFDADSAVLEVDRDVLSVRPEHIVTDIELVRLVASEGDWPRLLALLQESEAGLLTDLDGLDPEFDSWLRIERVNEPAKTFATATEAAERCIDEAGPRAALDIVSEILRLDPVNEEATRLALRIDHKLGDSRALHRHFHLLRDRLREEYNAEPSPGTTELFQQLTRGEAPPTNVGSAPAPQQLSGPRPRTLYWPPRRQLAILGAIVIALVSAALLTYNRSREASLKEPILLAVLPFEQHTRGDAYLAEGIWDDTRAALSHNSSLRLLGRATIAAAAQQGLSPEQYRQRFGVAYLLEGAVRRSGEQVLVSVSLTQTAGGLAIWEGTFRARLGDPLALQEAIANGIEGKLRGRLARGGGRRADQITTSPEVYALYSEARALMREREQSQVQRAEALLREAVALDPNYAPAWSSLALAIYHSGRGPLYDESDRAQAVAALRKALAIAPNLAEAHAILANVELGYSPAGERELRRAVALDPSYAEAWNWLGDTLHANYRYREAMDAFERAAKLDPLWLPPLPNLVWAANESGDRAAVERLFRRLRQAGASRELIETARAEDLLDRGDYSGSLHALMALGHDPQARSSEAVRQEFMDVLMLLGYPEAAAQFAGFPQWYGPLVRGERLPPATLEGRPVTPAEFWRTVHFTPFASRAMINLGQGTELVRIYRAAFNDADDFISAKRGGESITYLAPTLAIALRSEGHAAEADYILAAAAKESETGLKIAPEARQPAADLALIRAAQGERGQALRLLERAISRGWMPDGRRQSMDLAQEPAYRELRSDPSFQAARKRILDHVAKERAELGSKDFRDGA